MDIDQKILMIKNNKRINPKIQIKLDSETVSDVELLDSKYL